MSDGRLRNKAAQFIFGPEAIFWSWTIIWGAWAVIAWVKILGGLR